MVLLNAATRELTAKIVYYGPGLCGKTTNLQYVYDTLPQTGGKGKMLSLATQTDRTLFFDFLPIELGQIRGMKTRVQLYTVPGQVFYDATRKLVLRGADGVVFVADSQAPMLESNRESFQNLVDNLKEQGADLASMPHVIQFNKRDTPNALPISELNRSVNRFGVPYYEAIATRGDGVHETLGGITKLVMQRLLERYGGTPEEAQRPPMPPQPIRPPLPTVPIPLPPSPPPLPHPKPNAPFQVEELTSAEMLEEIEELPTADAAKSAKTPHPPKVSIVEFPVVLDRSMFQGESPVEIRLKVYLK